MLSRRNQFTSIGGYRSHSFVNSICTGCLILICGIFLASCKDFIETPAITQIPPTPTPEVFIPRTMVIPDEVRITGRVFQGTEPAPGMIVELYEGIDPNVMPVIARTVTDAQGIYELEAPPGGGIFGLAAFLPEGIPASTVPLTIEVSVSDKNTTVKIYLLHADAAVPAKCFIEGHPMYTDRSIGFCFAYPPHFTAQTSEMGHPAVYGPVLDDNVEALRASLLVEIDKAPPGGTLTQIVDSYLIQYASLDVPPIDRTTITFGNQPAELLTVVPGREGSQDIFTLHSGMLFHFMFLPSVRDFPQAKSDVELLFETVSTSFSLMLPTPASPDQPMPPVTSTLSYSQLDIPKANLSLEIPAGWLRQDPAWVWLPDANSDLRLGIQWADLQAPQEAEAVMLPSQSQILHSEPVAANWGSGRLFTIEVYTPAVPNGEKAQVQSVETHILIAIEHNGKRRVYDFFAAAPDLLQCDALKTSLFHMLETSTRLP